MSNGIDQFVFVVLLWNKKSAENWETMSVSDYSLGTMVICDFFLLRIIVFSGWLLRTLVISD